VSNEKAKLAVQSKTLWANFVMALMPFIPSDYVQDLFHQNPEIMIGIFAVVNFALRFLTKEPVQLK